MMIISCHVPPVSNGHPPPTGLCCLLNPFDPLPGLICRESAAVTNPWVFGRSKTHEQQHESPRPDGRKHKTYSSSIKPGLFVSSAIGAPKQLGTSRLRSNAPAERASDTASSDRSWRSWHRIAIASNPDLLRQMSFSMPGYTRQRRQQQKYGAFNAATALILMRSFDGLFGNGFWLRPPRLEAPAFTFNMVIYTQTLHAWHICLY